MFSLHSTMFSYFKLSIYFLLKTLKTKQWVSISVAASTALALQSPHQRWRLTHVCEERDALKCWLSQGALSRGSGSKTPRTSHCSPLERPWRLRWQNICWEPERLFTLIPSPLTASEDKTSPPHKGIGTWKHQVRLFIMPELFTKCETVPWLHELSLMKKWYRISDAMKDWTSVLV